jgi:ADP-ribose pyrophosphatase YjhB (NUDIX family)
MWGLPAASCREGEAILDAAKRIAVQKLGVSVDFGSTLGEGSQEREAYEIKMTLLEAHLDSDDDITLPGGPGNGSRGTTMYTEYRWGLASELNDSAAGGSLCSQLLLRSDH